jgi:hypothetical protein
MSIMVLPIFEARMRLPPENTTHSAVRPTEVRLRGAYLVEYAADELVVRHDVVHKVLCRVGELGKGLFYLYLFGKMHERTGTLQGGVPEGIQFVTFCTGGFNSLVGYFQAAVAVLHLP